jgi:hypothetical protein
MAILSNNRWLYSHPCHCKVVFLILNSLAAITQKALQIAGLLFYIEIR